MAKAPTEAPDPEYDAARRGLVEHLTKRAVTDPRVLNAFAQVPRHAFVPVEHRKLAYEDRALPLIEGQTISQPTMIAIMLEALDCAPGDRVLEVGGGCGYAAALLSYLAREVHTIEIRADLAEMAEGVLREIGVGRVSVHVGDGRKGLPTHAPFDRVLVSAAADSVPPPLLQQLSVGGRIAIPVEEDGSQVLRVGRKIGEPASMEWEESVPCLFVPLVHE